MNINTNNNTTTMAQRRSQRSQRSQRSTSQVSVHNTTRPSVRTVSTSSSATSSSSSSSDDEEESSSCCSTTTLVKVGAAVISFSAVAALGAYAGAHFTSGNEQSVNAEAVQKMQLTKLQEENERLQATATALKNASKKQQKLAKKVSPLLQKKTQSIDTRVKTTFEERYGSVSASSEEDSSAIEDTKTFLEKEEETRDELTKEESQRRKQRRVAASKLAYGHALVGGAAGLAALGGLHAVKETGVFTKENVLIPEEIIIPEHTLEAPKTLAGVENPIAQDIKLGGNSINLAEDFGIEERTVNPAELGSKILSPGYDKLPKFATGMLGLSQKNWAPSNAETIRTQTISNEALPEGYTLQAKYSELEQESKMEFMVAKHHINNENWMNANQLESVQVLNAEGEVVGSMSVKSQGEEFKLEKLQFTNADGETESIKVAFFQSDFDGEYQHGDSMGEGEEQTFLFSVNSPVQESTPAMSEALESPAEFESAGLQAKLMLGCCTGPFGIGGWLIIPFLMLLAGICYGMYYWNLSDNQFAGIDDGYDVDL